MGMIDLSDEILRRICWARQDALKSMWEITGINFEDTTNKIDYHNYMISNPLKIGGGMSGSLGDWADGERLPGGQLPIPPGFYSDAVLYRFISRAEGDIGVQWVSSRGGHDVVTSAACFGYDFPGGIHDPSFINRLGLTPADAQSLGITNNGRAPIGAESYGGRVQWGWYTQPIPQSHPYWRKLIPVYRDAMIWAWNQSIIQEVQDPAERLARMHSINWWGYRNLKLFHGGSGFPGRLRAARMAVGG